jgi:hypothetical protein
MRAEKIPVSAPIFNGATNITGPCRGASTSVAVWDSGCLRNTEYQILAGVPFVPGSFVIPAWRSVNFDSRAMMRFPQPEQPGLQTMLTDLSMGNCGVGFIEIPTDTGAQETSFCRPRNDNTVALVDNRKSILNVNNLDGKSLIVSPQTSQDVRTDNVSGNRTLEPNEINGLTINGNLRATGDAKVFNGNISVVNQIRAEKNISLLNPSASIPPSARTGSINSGGVVSNTLTVSNPANFNNSNLSVATDITNTASLTVSNDIVSRNLVKSSGSAGANITVSNDAVISGTITPASVVVTGATNTSGYNYITGSMAAVNLDTPTRNYNVSSSSAFRNNVSVANMAVTNRGTANCEGDCPLRTQDAECRNVYDFDSEGYTKCMDFVR